MMKVDLSIRVDGRPLSEFIEGALGDLPTFHQAKRVENLFSKMRKAEPFEVTEEEFLTVFSVFLDVPTRGKIAFSGMVEELNEGFDVVEYESSFNNPIDDRVPTVIEE